MFRKYEKTYHLSSDNKKVLDRDDLKQLLSGRVVVEEKMDGANVGIIRHKEGFHLQKRGSLVGQSEHSQFGFFHNWAWNNADKILELPVGYIIYGELMYAVHTLYYDRLPDWFLAFDVWDGNKFLKYRKRWDFCKHHGFSQVPTLAEGYFTKNEILDIVPEKSRYGPISEGIVVKRYSKNRYIRAKVIKPEFQKAMYDNDHWMHKPVETNQVIRS